MKKKTGIKLRGIKRDDAFCEKVKTGVRTYYKNNPKKKKAPTKNPFSLDCLKFTDFSVKVYIGGSDPGNVTYACGAVSALADGIFEYLDKRKLLDRGEFIILPCYSSDQMSVNFSICFFTSIIKILSSFVHTNKGDYYAKRRYREHHG